MKDAIKKAFGCFRTYCDSSVLKVKEDSNKKLSKASSELKNLIWAHKVLFRFKGNKTQFEFNSGLSEKLEKAIGEFEGGEPVTACDKIK